MHGQQPGHVATAIILDILVMPRLTSKKNRESTDPPATRKPIGKALLGTFFIIIIFASGLSGF
jgi:hypothetical protein